MKKSILASVIALGMVSGLAQAAGNEVQFVGSVVATTCDLEASGTGSDAGLVKNIIELGQTKINTPGKEVTFVFKPVNDAQNQQNCEQLAGSGSKVVLTWNSNAFDGQNGLGAISGAASDAFVTVQALNADTNNNVVMLTSGASQEFAAAKLASDGLQYKAQLVGKTQPGDFQTASKFTVHYK
ncbi:putative fimbrial protein FanC [Escherichia coli]|uniref:fimbrial protein n=1 Tax=Escherichia coli TaxID=562 RepID=UPI0018151639|nr:fimbrial protein [Escherichia coli]EFC9510244.1 fimbrial protein [Escherichia coli]CAD5881985.1 putative fimbrial protein FanC [Escherichia coli]